MLIGKKYFFRKLLILLVLLNSSLNTLCWSQNIPSFNLLNQKDLQLVSVSFSEAEIWKKLKEKSISPQEIFQVFVGKNIPDNNPPIIGRYSLQDSAISFQPAFSFRPGMEYTAVFLQQHYWTFHIPDEQGYPLPKVTAVYPSSDTLPANQLKLYLHFATPMGEGRAYQFIHLTNVDGDTLQKAFLELEPELWDRNRQRLTIWFDPGRVKRALGPNEMSGTPLQEGNWYTLHLDHNWEDAQSHALSTSFTKRFYVGPSDRKQPDVNKWKISLPKTDTRDPLAIHFGEALDQALALRTISIVDPQGQLIDGQFSLINGESVALFHPKSNWYDGSYGILIKAILEDLAGNNLNRPFDRDLAQKGVEVKQKDVYQLQFVIKK